jgi:hypothetical protein
MLMQKSALQNQPTSLFNSKIAVTNKSKLVNFSLAGGYAISIVEISNILKAV